MELYFVVILTFLLLLAAFDLFVGVSNDAVNFLTSAVGSRIAPFKVITMVAGLGVLIGATFSGGMMEVARSGVFNPQMFTFEEVMIIFFAVMVTDVLMLDIFNSFGLPTSTSVSIVFELLGGAVAMAMLKLFNHPLSGQSVADFINSEKALKIISGILSSVIIAFTAGIIIQYIVRLIFTFKYQKIYRYAGSLFGGIAITAILYFLVIKGAGGASFMRPEYLEWIRNHTLTILLYTFLATTFFFQLSITLFKANIFKVVILAGTFALAFAFAGNDLVNFVGVPLAALDSFNAYKVSAMAADSMTMEVLLGAARTPTAYLLLSGLIMVATLTFSKKARRVTQTSVNLSSSSRGAKEQFGSSVVARAITRSSSNFAKVVQQLFPPGVHNVINRRMAKVKPQKGEVQLPFDHIRASINLVVSAILIAVATSLTLPLSTTYVTFMVAMGSSLADGAWDRESAVYRINGVLSVIGGWFLTAFCAFTCCGLVAVVLFFGGTIVAVILLIIVLLVLIKSNFFPKRKEEALPAKFDKVDKIFICHNVNNSVSLYFDSILRIYKDALTEFLDENLSTLRKTKNKAIQLYDEMAAKRGEYYRFAYEGSEDKVSSDARYYYYRIFTNLKEIGSGLKDASGMAYNHINNNHSVYRSTLRKNLLVMIEDLEDLRNTLIEYAQSPFHGDDRVTERTNQSIVLINSLQHQLLTRIERHNLSLRSCELYLNYLQFSRDIINRFSLVALLQHELNEKCRINPD
ncbi:MAG: inorganic phosphate transporter [Bacteroidetes bacterium]|nr:inorganic phosphate transporter [Bacteroidota bacterium]